MPRHNGTPSTFSSPPTLVPETQQLNFNYPPPFSFFHPLQPRVQRQVARTAREKKCGGAHALQVRPAFLASQLSFAMETPLSSTRNPMLPRVRKGNPSQFPRILVRQCARCTGLLVQMHSWPSHGHCMRTYVSPSRSALARRNFSRFWTFSSSYAQHDANGAFHCWRRAPGKGAGGFRLTALAGSVEQVTLKTRGRPSLNKLATSSAMSARQS